MKRTPRITGRIALGVVGTAVCCWAIACIPPPPGAHISVHAEGLLPPLPPPPPFVLPASISVVHSSRLGCDYVHGVNYDVFYVGGYFYTHHHDHWYCSARPGASWVVVEPRYVPRVLAAGPPPPGWRTAPIQPPRRVTTFHRTLPFPLPPNAGAATISRSQSSAGPRAVSPPSTGRPRVSPSARPYAPGQRKGSGSARPYAPGQVKKSAPPAPRPPAVQPGSPSRPPRAPGKSGAAPGQSKKEKKPRPGRKPGRK